MKIKKSARRKYEWFISLTRINEPRLIERAQTEEAGVDAISAFHILESTGRKVPTREPLLFERYVAGKAWHGVTVEMVAEDFAINRLISSREIKENYQDWVANEIFCLAEKISLKRNGYVPSFVKNRRDISEFTDEENSTFVRQCYEQNLSKHQARQIPSSAQDPS